MSVDRLGIRHPPACYVDGAEIFQRGRVLRVTRQRTLKILFRFGCLSRYRVQFPENNPEIGVPRLLLNRFPQEILGARPVLVVQLDPGQLYRGTDVWINPKRLIQMLFRGFFLDRKSVV